ncbi:MAG: beta-glucuronidase [Cytophagaceae bacterium]|jgi:beta-glucuronidase|nr:beta-glucuronidase [Cytophagaceae bacterium]
MLRILWFILSFLCLQLLPAQQELMVNVWSRKTISLNGQWEILIDPYENGFYNYRYEEHPNGFFKNQAPANKQELIEYDFVSSDYLNVPGDWNSQRKELLYYEGTIWYKKDFNYDLKAGKRLHLYVGASNYYSHVYVNGTKVAEHEGGFTPYVIDVSDKLKPGSNFVVIKVDNKRKVDGIPTINTDWWNYGGITRDVVLVETDEVFIRDYVVQLKKGDRQTIRAQVRLNKPSTQTVQLEIPEAGIKKTLSFTESDYQEIEIPVKNLQLWSPAAPKLYQVMLRMGAERMEESIGFRTIETRGTEILLNGNPVFLKGICIHEEIPQRVGRANGPEDAAMLLQWAKELGCNYVRLAHYPHNEHMVKLADKMGLMVWSEIPVYWTVQFGNATVLKKASAQLQDMVKRDRNRASVIIWSMANETPPSENRNNFLRTLCEQTRQLDNTRLVSAALEIHNYDGTTMTLDDPLGEYLDVLGCNEYIGWYVATPEACLNRTWESKYNKPLVITEFGGEALFNKHGSKDERWTEEYMAYMYECQLKMLSKISFLRGMSPWILADFRSPRRQLHGVQDMWNRKGLISDKGQRKMAFYIMQDFYKNKK